MKLAFTKMEGIGNDYIYMDGISQHVPTDPAFIQRICDRHFGIGSDGLIVILSSENADFKMRMFNLDGSEGMMCGNGIRCFAKFCYDHNLINKTSLLIETKAGLRQVELMLENNQVVGAKVDMGKPILDTKEVPVLFSKSTMVQETIIVDDTEYKGSAISMGNPHFVIFSKDIDTLDLVSIGPKFEYHEMFPESVNTEFVEILDSNHVKMRVWERGSGETMACGTGACAVMYACYLAGLVENLVIVTLLGGDLVITYQDDHIFMSGPATTVFQGEIEI